MRDDDDNTLVRLNSMYAEGESLLNLIQITDKKNNKNYNDNNLLRNEDIQESNIMAVWIILDCWWTRKPTCHKSDNTKYIS